MAETLLPPWAAEASVLRNCTRCSACIQSCPEGILTVGDGGFPVVDFHRGSGECTFCGACADACDHGVFAPRDEAPWSQTVAISHSCLAHWNVHCSSCRDACPESAIRFAPRLGGPPLPELDAERCTGCGACVGICPEEAIRPVRPVSEHAA